jgi:DNA-binding Lrp family transcriptional regulator
LPREDASSTNAHQGKRVGLTGPAVRHRFARLRSDGTIVRYTVVTRPLGPEGLVLMRRRPGRTGEIPKFVKGRASEVFETSGEFDLGAFIEQPILEWFAEELDRLRSLEGVVPTATLVGLARSVRSPVRAGEPGARMSRSREGSGGPSRSVRAFVPPNRAPRRRVEGPRPVRRSSSPAFSRRRASSPASRGAFTY